MYIRHIGHIRIIAIAKSVTMKIYLLCAVILSIYQLSVVHGYECPGTDPVITCPRPDALSCLRFCSNAKDQQQPYVCPNTDPPVQCTLRPVACVRFCRNAELEQQAQGK